MEEGYDEWDSYRYVEDQDTNDVAFRIFKNKWKSKFNFATED